MLLSFSLTTSAKFARYLFDKLCIANIKVATYANARKVELGSDFKLHHKVGPKFRKQFDKKLGFC
jgi:hypothetical protein